jgi:hypothetical protein
VSLTSNHQFFSRIAKEAGRKKVDLRSPMSPSVAVFTEP